MSYIIKVKQSIQVLVDSNGSTKTKTLLPEEKYIVSDIKNNQVVDLKKSSCLTVKQASNKEESCFEHLNLA